MWNLKYCKLLIFFISFLAPPFEKTEQQKLNRRHSNNTQIKLIIGAIDTVIKANIKMR